MSGTTDDDLAPGPATDHARFAFDDAAYVLGALDGTELQAFQQHLTGCPSCQESVAELSGLPPLLAMVSPAEVPLAAEELSGSTGPPDTLLPSLMLRIRDARRRQRLRTALTGLAAACLLAVLTLGGVQLWNHAHRPAALAMQQVGPGAGTVQATITFTGSGAGTRIALDCTYRVAGAAGYPGVPAPSYRMTVFSRSGQSRDLGSWTPEPNEEVQIARASPWTRQDISRVVVTDAQGTAVLVLVL